jgi:Asp-tRNA(Asn)/Glu-tRNA(Gln) amidotransferase A subunit family amidase
MAKKADTSFGFGANTARPAFKPAANPWAGMAGLGKRTRSKGGSGSGGKKGGKKGGGS